MKTAFANSLRLFTVCAGLTVAGMAQAGVKDCRRDSVATGLVALCAAEVKRVAAPVLS